jgi:hypothetical protein
MQKFLWNFLRENKRKAIYLKEQATTKHRPTKHIFIPVFYNMNETMQTKQTLIICFNSKKVFQCIKRRQSFILDLTLEKLDLFGITLSYIDVIFLSFMFSIDDEIGTHLWKCISDIISLLHFLFFFHILQGMK